MNQLELNQDLEFYDHLKKNIEESGQDSSWINEVVILIEGLKEIVRERQEIEI